ncbi:isopentenyl-diphosphate Delta-isomerase [Mycolicibacterium thermoresistibile]|jgi:isopentenyl-diphosphate delta-isomerase|uniref:Isopentenyl-diphosphate Delta-isomerase n=2 Tax=Mycolicibacterium thermoresistibile TaxID=1797 RepID=G7CDD2_MYCT3|nr:isopentenyl-diphosphate Delta-isomerase [Mycolicibacterium thermoresistibile]EHI13956.1 isopentenyl-diphosphate delta-isomerase [Mycolicibacterium thermoresistibile ATCC 19527]MCV7187557.1 isopentenyl-diphosphate Delta-isomerase [Mycolicibacterium thermoresistibile]GAT17174.1 isopentenyl-diphosphate delta-isomerase [Mycolicibacterium thermoresistibile]SNW16447.1 isopentenyl-diphosphate delta-isomerase [Mycolicibacterium thermoresistibile]
MTVVDTEEFVVLLDEQGRQVGTAPKVSVHHQDTPLHLGFSCYLLDGDGRVLLTRRALVKRTWPGVWTNSCCGHPGPGEPIEEAVRRRAHHELGLRIEEPVCVLPDFRYHAVAADGTAENEICPVFVARADGPVRPAADEVMDWRWVRWQELRAAAELPWSISPWAAVQIPLLHDTGAVG